ncbi:Na+/H+ antiporter NhaC [Halovenus aranensis]|uniref:Na+/H+ antiporter NhaC n=1 Tax=Halovenus aranensis TaxID=890420 RepID=A0A1G8XI77_9EURY|nr:Na+/H+ antiporter NhaC family protein [Halovenus aranensis]SDJ90308.1 Na+/H+ antiporter NhaC [Halovenus aranensis]
MVEATVWSVVPPLVAIGLAIITRKAILSLFLGIWSGAVLYTGNVGIIQTFDWIVAAILADEGFHVRIILFTLLLGSGVAMIWRLGGAVAIRNWAMTRIDSQRTAGLMAWGLGTGFFFDDYANTAIVGSTMKEISDNLRISREKLSYLIDSTAAPAATLGISSWVAFQISMIELGYEETGLPEEEIPGGFSVFLEAWPFNMYSILAIVMVFVIVVTQRDFGEMLFAERRSATTGKVNRDGARPMQDVEGDLGKPNVDDPKIATFVVPILVLVVGVLGVAAWTGNVFQGAGVEEFSDNADFTLALLLGSFGMVASSYVLGYAYGILSLGESVDTTIDGFGIMLTAVTILVLAWSLGETVSALETGRFVSEQIDGLVGENLLPVIVFLAAAFTAFSTGSSWGTMSILTPIAIPVAWDIAASHELVAVMVGMIFSGAIFGDHSSPISDTTVLSATFSGADLIDHVRTQLYYAVTVALVVIVLMLIWGFTGVTPWLLLLLGIGMVVGLVYGLSTLQTNVFDIEPIQEPEYEEISQDQ